MILLSLLSAAGMFLIALTPTYTDGGTISSKMAGVVLASLSSGGGELSFVSLTHYYGPFSLAAWGSGTGGAGLVGAGAYAFATTSLGLSSKNALLASAFLPIIMLLSFFVVLPHGPLARSEAGAHNHGSGNPSGERRDNEDELHQSNGEEEGLLQDSEERSSSSRQSAVDMKADHNWTGLLMLNLRRSRSLFFPL